MSYLDDLFGVRDKVALVTGGSRGIGLMIAEGFVRAGAKTYVSSRKAEVCEAEATRLAAHGTCIPLPADLGSLAGCEALAAAFREREPKLHVLVNNAGANWGAPMAEYPDAAWDKVLELNVKSVFNLTRALLSQLEAAASHEDPARVIDIGSIDGLRAPEMDTFAYSASKAAVHHLSRVLAQKLAPKKITVNAVAPGPFESKMMAVTLEAFHEHIIQSCPLRRIGAPEDMAGIALYLASKAGSYVTGAVIPVDGGMSTWRGSW
jgi:NAD(P)-dependent dehydrogenase (short-subunit alcohol dehydrogenase family)